MVRSPVTLQIELVDLLGRVGDRDRAAGAPARPPGRRSRLARDDRDALEVRVGVDHLGGDERVAHREDVVGAPRVRDQLVVADLPVEVREHRHLRHLAQDVQGDVGDGLDDEHSRLHRDSSRVRGGRTARENLSKNVLSVPRRPWYGGAPGDGEMEVGMPHVRVSVYCLPAGHRRRSAPARARHRAPALPAAARLRRLRTDPDRRGLGHRHQHVGRRRPGRGRHRAGRPVDHRARLHHGELGPGTRRSRVLLEPRADGSESRREGVPDLRVRRPRGHEARRSADAEARSRPGAGPDRGRRRELQRHLPADRAVPAGAAADPPRSGGRRRGGSRRPGGPRPARRPRGLVR